MTRLRDLYTEALYTRVFDAYAALPASARFGLSLKDSAAGAALRSWAAAHKIDVVPETIEGEIATWTLLRAELPGDVFPSISVSLDDDIPRAGVPIEAEIHF